MDLKTRLIFNPFLDAKTALEITPFLIHCQLQLANYLLLLISKTGDRAVDALAGIRLEIDSIINEDFIM